MVCVYTSMLQGVCTQLWPSSCGALVLVELVGYSKCYNPIKKSQNCDYVISIDTSQKGSAVAIRIGIYARLPCVNFRPAVCGIYSS